MCLLSFTCGSLSYKLETICKKTYEVFLKQFVCKVIQRCVDDSPCARECGLPFLQECLVVITRGSTGGTCAVERHPIHTLHTGTRRCSHQRGRATCIVSHHELITGCPALLYFPVLIAVSILKKILIFSIFKNNSYIFNIKKILYFLLIVRCRGFLRFITAKVFLWLKYTPMDGGLIMVRH